MRKLIVAAAAIACAAPAAAQPYPDPRDEEIVRALPHPGEIEALGDTLARVTDAIMDVPIGPIVEAIDPGRRVDPRQTLGDVASRDDPYARERMRDRIQGATIGLGAAVEQLAVVTPVMRRALEDAARRMEEAMNESRARVRDRR